VVGISLVDSEIVLSTGYGKARVFINKTLSTETTYQQDLINRDLLSTSLIVGKLGSGMWCDKFNSTSNVLVLVLVGEWCVCVLLCVSSKNSRKTKKESNLHSVTLGVTHRDRASSPTLTVFVNFQTLSTIITDPPLSTVG
jgi:hypothetical protein